MTDPTDKELNALFEQYRLPQAAGKDLALRSLALHMWGEFHVSKYGLGTWYRPMYTSKKTLTNYRRANKGRAPGGVIPDERSWVEVDPKAVAKLISGKAQDREEILTGLSKVIAWLLEFEQALRGVEVERR
jgi:hypothetical protein